MLACLDGARNASGGSGIALTIGLATYGETVIYYAVVPGAAERFPAWGDLGPPTFYTAATVAVIHLLRRWDAELRGVTWLDAGTAPPR